jgi:restriction system protein
MGAITFSIRNYLDTIIDVVGIKSGIVLNRTEVLNILKTRFDDWYLTEQDLEYGIRIRSEELEHHIRFVRFKIGNLTDEMLNPFLWGDILMKWYEKGIDPMPVMNSLAQVSAKYAHQRVDPTVIVQEMKDITGAPTELIVEIVVMYANHQFQSCDVTLPERKDWDGGTPLQTLFNCEIRPNSSDFLEQKFLDYLAVNADLLKTIHWRNFERFCAAFFSRMGYEIILGPGTNDGGVDIRAYDKLDNSKPLILIQCKRYKEENKVSIETVKSFYTDVAFEDAKQGIIITTSYISEGGKKVSEARRYPLSFAEKEDVEKWAASM